MPHDPTPNDYPEDVSHPTALRAIAARDVIHFIALCAHQGLGYFPERSLEDSCSKETLIEHILSGELHRPMKIFSFNVIEGWSRDVTEDIAREVAGRLDVNDMIPETLIDFIETHAGLEYARGLRVSDATFAAE
jgi:hypothetical protein